MNEDPVFIILTSVGLMIVGALIGIVLFGSAGGFSQPEPDYSLAGPMKHHIAGTQLYIYVVTKDYTFTSWEEAVAFVKKHEKEKKE